MNSHTSDVDHFSTQLADAVQRAAAWTVRVHARRGTPASGILHGQDLVVTADHVVDPSREERIRVGLPDGREVEATIAGRDPATDLALLKLPERTAPEGAAPGQPARVGALGLVVARPGREPTASLAFVSGLGGSARTRRGGVLERFIQVDAVMYPGFSGGPLVDTSGGVLGMATSGIAFGGPSIAIPWDLVSEMAGAILDHGKVRRGYLGLGSQPVELSAAVQALLGGQQRGLLVVHVEDNGPVAGAGVLQGDILVQMDGQSISSADDLQGLLGPSSVGRTVTLSLVRGGERRDLSATIGVRE